jgi:hypothetical protein
MDELFMVISQLQWQAAHMNKYNMFISKLPHTTELSTLKN